MIQSSLIATWVRFEALCESIPMIASMTGDGSRRLALRAATQGERENSTRTSDSDSHGEQPIDTDYIRTMLE